MLPKLSRNVLKSVDMTKMLFYKKNFSKPQEVLLCREQFHFAVSSFYFAASKVLLCREAVLLFPGQFYLAVHEAVLIYFAVKSFYFAASSFTI